MKQRLQLIQTQRIESDVCDPYRARLVETDAEILSCFPECVKIEDLLFTDKTIRSFHTDRWNQYAARGVVDESILVINRRPAYLVDGVRPLIQDKAETLLVVDFGSVRAAVTYPDHADCKWARCERCDRVRKPARPCFSRFKLGIAESSCNCGRAGE